MEGFRAAAQDRSLRWPLSQLSVSRVAGRAARRTHDSRVSRTRSWRRDYVRLMHPGPCGARAPCRAGMPPEAWRALRALIRAMHRDAARAHDGKRLGKSPRAAPQLSGTDWLIAAALSQAAR